MVIPRTTSFCPTSSLSTVFGLLPFLSLETRVTSNNFCEGGLGTVKCLRYRYEPSRENTKVLEGRGKDLLNFIGRGTNRTLILTHIYIVVGYDIEDETREVNVFYYCEGGHGSVKCLRYRYRLSMK